MGAWLSSPLAAELVLGSFQQDDQPSFLLSPSNSDPVLSSLPATSDPSLQASSSSASSSSSSTQESQRIDVQDDDADKPSSSSSSSASSIGGLVENRNGIIGCGCRCKIELSELIDRLVLAQDDLTAEVRHLQQTAAVQAKRLLRLEEEKNNLQVQLEIFKLQASSSSSSSSSSSAATIAQLTRKLELLEATQDHLQDQLHNKQKDDATLRTTINDLQGQIDILEFGPSERMKKVAGSIGKRTTDTLKRKPKARKGGSVSFAVAPEPRKSEEPVVPIIITDDVLDDDDDIQPKTTSTPSTPSPSSSTSSTTSTSSSTSSSTAAPGTPHPAASTEPKRGLRSWMQRPVTAAANLSLRMAEAARLHTENEAKSVVVPSLPLQDNPADSSELPPVKRENQTSDTTSTATTPAPTSATPTAAAKSTPRRRMANVIRYQRRFPDPVVSADDEDQSTTATPAAATTPSDSNCTDESSPAAQPAVVKEQEEEQKKDDDSAAVVVMVSPRPGDSPASSEVGGDAPDTTTTTTTQTPANETPATEQPVAIPRLRSWTSRLRRPSLPLIDAAESSSATTTSAPSATPANDSDSDPTFVKIEEPIQQQSDDSPSEVSDLSESSSSAFPKVDEDPLASSSSSYSESDSDSASPSKTGNSSSSSSPSSSPTGTARQSVVLSLDLAGDRASTSADSLSRRQRRARPLSTHESGGPGALSARTSSSELRGQDNRAYIIREILTTEVNFVKQLAVLIDHIVAGLIEQASASAIANAALLSDSGAPAATEQQEGSSWISVTEISHIFSSLPQIYANHKKFLAALEGLLTAAFFSLPDEEQVVGDIVALLPSVIETGPYTEYMTNFNRALATISGCETRPGWTAYFKQAAIKEVMFPRVLSDFLILPVQQPPRYPMHLRRLLSRTPETHPDHATVARVLAETEECLNTINVNKGRREILEQLHSAKEMISTTSGKLSELLSRSSRLLKLGELSMLNSHKTGTFFLFNTVFLRTVQEVDSHRWVAKKFYLPSQICGVTKSAIASDKPVFEVHVLQKTRLRSKKKKTFFFVAPTPLELRQWISCFATFRSECLLIESVVKTQKDKEKEKEK